MSRVTIRVPRACAVRHRLAIMMLAGLGVIACSDAGKDRPSAVPAGDLPDAAPMAAAPDRLGLGSEASSRLLAAIDIDANPAGIGLPSGSGTHAAGAALYAVRCASCHGRNGEGVATFPRLVSQEADTGFNFGNDVKLVKTVGNYWPHATTLYDYIRRTMPYDAPGSLRPDDVYSLVAYLLAENRVIPRTAVMNARTLPAVRMPARGRFVRDDRVGGPGFR